MSTPLRAYVQGIGLLGPGIADWPSAVCVLNGETSWTRTSTLLPSPERLPSAERRRTGSVVKLALAVGLEASARATADPATLATVFTSSGGDGQNCHEICQALAASDCQLSPTRFHNSVHNAAAGYWGIATGAMAPSNALCAFDGSFAAGLLESLIQLAIERTPVLLIAYDGIYPEPLRLSRPIPDPFGIALVLSPSSGPASVAQLEARLCDSPPDRMRDAALEALRGSIPAARSLPLLERLAQRRAGHSVLEYLDGLALDVEVSACR
ncbi:MAG TPA: beta-ketoacyl synthase chain length factor [Steroidobacteraceae bacterium]|nr:beta-ketoacyl synthase chain length factor [Steroidobacteraceae bacterium]